VTEPVASCIVFGKKHGQRYITVAEDGGQTRTLAMSETVYRAMILRINEIELDESRAKLRAEMLAAESRSPAR